MAGKNAYRIHSTDPNEELWQEILIGLLLKLQPGQD